MEIGTVCEMVASRRGGSTRTPGPAGRGGTTPANAAPHNPIVQVRYVTYLCRVCGCMPLSPEFYGSSFYSNPVNYFFSPHPTGPSLLFINFYVFYSNSPSIFHSRKDWKSTSRDFHSRQFQSISGHPAIAEAKQ